MAAGNGGVLGKDLLGSEHSGAEGGGETGMMRVVGAVVWWSRWWCAVVPRSRLEKWWSDPMPRSGDSPEVVPPSMSSSSEWWRGGWDRRLRLVVELVVVVVGRVEDKYMFSLFSDQCEDTRRPEESLSRRRPLLVDRRSRCECVAAGPGLCRRHSVLGSGSGLG